MQISRSLASYLLFAFVLYSVFIAASIGGIAELYASIQKALGATEELLKIQNEKIEILDKKYTQKIIGNLEFKKVNFSYPSRTNTNVLQNLSFKINKVFYKGVTT